MLKRDTISPSLHEVEALAAKAARGAGAGWGVAEDVARAARWVSRHGLDWADPLLRLLGTGASERTLAPVFEVADRLAGARAGDRFALDGIAPVWILAILAGALYGRDLSIDLAGAGWRLRLRSDGGVGADGPRIAALPPGAVTVRVLADASALPAPFAGAAGRRAVSAPVWRELEAYAARTYVEPSLRSRRTGAGGGRVDDD